ADASKPNGPVVWLFSSPSTQAQLLKTGLDGGISTRVWENFLRKYKIPFNRISNAEALSRMSSGVLLLPSVVVLNDGWTVVTKDSSYSAHYEHTVAIFDDGVLVLSDHSGIEKACVENPFLIVS
ncbi:MAG: hypothetical protein RLZZ479_751, partial [Bacteroidota bacterium]